MKPNLMAMMCNLGATVIAVVEIFEPGEMSAAAAVSIVGLLILGKLWMDSP